MNNANSRSNEMDVKPWYREFWPWFIIVLIGSVMVASLSTVYIAISGADQVVSENYYKEGLTVNKDIELDLRAKALGLSADLTVADTTISLQLSEPLPGEVTIHFFHPLEEGMDFSLPLTSTGNGGFGATLPDPLKHRWHIEITDDQRNWRLKQTVVMNEGQLATRLTPPE